MYKPTLLLILLALLLAACTFQVTTLKSTPTISAFPLITDAPATQISAPPTQTPLAAVQTTIPSPTQTQPGGLLYLWPASLPPEMKLDSAKSSYSSSGYWIEFTNSQPGADTILRAGTEADRYPYCNGQTSPYQIRGMEGCLSMGTGAGASVAWMENGVHYSVGGIENSPEMVTQFANNLMVLDYQSWQQKFVDTANTTAAPSRTRIEFVPGTTSNPAAYQELGGGDSDEYILGALAGQELSVNVAPYTFADSKNFVLSISGIDGSMLVSEAAQVSLWSGTLPITQDYVIRVTNQGNAAQYQLKVSLPLQIHLAAGKTSTTLEGRLLLGADGNTYLLHAQAGQTMAVTTTSANNNACLTIAARMTDGSYIPLLRLMEQSTTWGATLPTGTEYSQDYSISVSFCNDMHQGDTLYTLFVRLPN